MFFCEDFLGGGIISTSMEIVYDGEERIFCITDVNILDFK